MDVPAIDAVNLMIAAVERIPPQAWDQPSNLADWTLRELVGHATGSAAKVVALAAGEQVWGGPSQPADWICDDPAARLRELAARLRDVLADADPDALRSSPEGEVPLWRAMAFPVADLALHSWDVHHSLGEPADLPEPLLAFCRGLVDSVPQDALRRPGAFGPAQPVPESATPTAALMGYLGRSVGAADPAP